MRRSGHMPTTDVTAHSDPKKLFAELSARGIDAEAYTKNQNNHRIRDAPSTSVFLRQFGTRTIAMS
jgi:hypothetical protein